MKKILTFLMLVALLTACKKKEEPSQQPEPLLPAPTFYLFSLKVDGTEKKCSSECYSSIYSGGFYDIVLNLNGSAEQVIFSWDNLPQPGQHPLIKYGEPSVKYGKGSFSYPARTGTLNIISLDTAANGRINKLSANFAFKTDTLNGLFFNITEGTVNIK